MSDVPDLDGLVEYVRSLGATDTDIEAAATAAGLGPLALDLAIRPPGDSPTLDEFVRTSSLDEGFVHRAWRALGLPDHTEFPFPVTPDIAAALEALAFLAGAVGENSVLALARVIGATSAQLADALSSTMRVGVEVPRRDTGTSYLEIARDYTSAARELLPTLWESVGAVFRRHLVLVSYQGWSIDEERVAVTMDRAVGFVDLVDSTGALRSLSVSALAQLVDGFERYVGDLVVAAGGRVVKLIGDEAMFTFGDPATACRVARDLVTTATSPVRVGLAYGPVVALHGDVYGPTVNLAARLVAVAEPGTLLVAPAVHDAVGDSGLRFEPRSVPELQGFPEVTGAWVAR